MPHSRRSLLLVGDSDIARWPPHLLPFACDGDGGGRDFRRRCGHDDDHDGRHESPEKDPPLQPRGKSKGSWRCRVSGRDGATMGEALEAVRVEIREWKEAMRMTVFKGEDGDDGGDDQGTDPSSHLYLVLCAGENDIGLGVPLEDTVERLSSLFDVLRDASVGLVDAADGDQTTSAAPSGHQECAAGAVVSIVLLGPKLEPWLAGDVESRKQYIRMSRALESRCKAATDNARAETAKQLLRVLFVDCLTMFCFPDSVSRPGALLGGRAVPDSSYFDKDQLHLNERGYLVWKRVAEEALLSVGWGQSDCHVPR